MKPHRSTPAEGYDAKRGRGRSPGGALTLSILNSPLRLSIAFSPSNVVATANQKSRQSCRRLHEARGWINTNITDEMRSGPDQRPRGRFNANRPFRQQPRIPQTVRRSTATGPTSKSAAAPTRSSSGTSPWHAKRQRATIELPPRISTSTRSTIFASTTRAARAISTGRRRGRPHRLTSRLTHPTQIQEKWT